MKALVSFILFSIYTLSSTDESATLRMPNANMASSFAIAQADFALKMLKEQAKEHESVIFSPFSILEAFAIIYAGADGNTKSEIGKILAEGQPEDKIHEFYGELMKKVSTETGNYSLDAANRIYVHKGFQILKGFSDMISANYNGQLKSADFGESEAVTNEINHWVETETHSKIKDLVQQSMVSPQSRIIIVNAVYFKGDWVTKFAVNQTRNKPFYYAENKEREVSMMHSKGNFQYVENEDFQVLVLPYKGEDVKMVIFLPKEKHGLSKVENCLTGRKMLELIEETGSEEVVVEIPKFKVEHKIELVQPLINLGVKDAFDSGAANFSKMSNEPLYISDAIHKAFIEVNEEGTEAAAATFMVMARMSAMPSRIPRHFIANHPFFIIIMTKDTILFVGRYV